MRYQVSKSVPPRLDALKAFLQEFTNEPNSPPDGSVEVNCWVENNKETRRPEIIQIFLAWDVDRG